MPIMSFSCCSVVNIPPMLSNSRSFFMFSLYKSVDSEWVISYLNLNYSKFIMFKLLFVNYWAKEYN